MKGRKNIVVAFSVASHAGQQWLAGINAYAGSHNWMVREINESETSSMCRAFDVKDADGLIRTTHPVPGHRIPDSGLPTVYIANSADVPPRGSTVVRNDNAAFAEKVAALLIAKKLRHFAFLRFDNFVWEHARCEAFVKAVEKAGFTADVFTPNLTQSEEHDRARLADWLRALPKPCGLMAAFDDRARLALDTARSCGIRVPDELCVVGVDNNVSVCENAMPSLSSFEPDFAREGWLAAEALDVLMSRRVNAPITVVNAGGDVVERASSAYLPKLYRCAAKAMEVIRIRCSESLSIADIVALSGVSRRMLELRFKELYGDTVQNKLRKQRIEQVKHQLRNTTLPIEEICALSGYANISYLKRAFKSATGQTMRAFRNYQSRLTPKPTKSA